MGTTLVEHAAQQLVALIKNQRLGAGDKLPTESELTELLAVGRGTVREAVKVLTSRNRYARDPVFLSLPKEVCLKTRWV